MGTHKVKDHKAATIENFIGPDAVFTGDIETSVSIRIDGAVKGNIKKADAVIVGDKANVTGNINGSIIVVGGIVKGDITASHSIEIKSHAQVRGKLNTTLISIAEGALFEGSLAAAGEHEPPKKPEQHIPVSSHNPKPSN